MKRIAPGFYQIQRGMTYTYICRSGQRWFVSPFWMGEYGPDRQEAMTKMAVGKGLKHSFPTLAMAVSAAKGNRAS